MTVAHRLAEEIDILQLTIQTMSELARAAERCEGTGDWGAVSLVTDRLTELAQVHGRTYAELSDLLKSLRNRRYDMGMQSLVDRIQSKES